ncbi:type II toxin-antitoxin system PemK/MazF family toxin [Pseudactinotalea sp.]|uniref:type II toxin-antitoxin system PemK/MazF family toxin n=1 Tax=Pseudactinotalea sp. TaxID=1926260 RepID=UPI003B3BE1FE
MIRGELWTLAGGVYASKPRPALVIQDDAFAATESVTVLPLTSHLLDAPLLRVRISATELSGLDRDSDVMVDKLTTVRRANVSGRVGRLSTEQLGDVERAVMAFLGFAR